MRRIFFLFGLVLAIISFKTHAQTVPAGTPVLDDYYRREQLLGKIDSNVSFSMRPLLSNSNLNVADVFDPDISVKSSHDNSGTHVDFANGKGIFRILPFTWQQQFNSDHPYGWNDEAMIPAKGYQTIVSTGFYFKIGPLSIQLRPEYVYAANPPFSGYFTNYRRDSELQSYFAYFDLTDAPERFGNGAYSKLFWGQSNIKLTLGPVEAGLSNESLWWGPGIHNALIISDNAPGFKHITLNTNRPIKTSIGYFEGQVIGGRLENSGLPPLLEPANTPYYSPKENNWRYLTGFNINYHPKWLPGLTMGLTRTFQSYGKDVKTLSAYLPFFTPYTKVNTVGIDNGTGDPFPRDQYTSMYGRWLFTKAQAEVYFEYGLNDNSYNLADFIGAPEHSMAYIAGFRKMIQLNRKPEQHILFGAEVTQLSETVDRLVRSSGGWYQHSQVRQGQTNMGQTLGAGTGTGGNLQSFEISWLSGLKKLGIQFDRYEHAVDFSDAYLNDINGNSRKWVDFGFSLNGEWNYKKLLFNIKLEEVKSLNYEWILKDYDSRDSFYIPHNTVYNFHGELGITYRF